MPLFHVVGDVDDVVPVSENTAVIEKRYKALGGHIEVIHKPDVGHHPHSLQDPKPIVKFILDAVQRRYSRVMHQSPRQPRAIRTDGHLIKICGGPSDPL